MNQYPHTQVVDNNVQNEQTVKLSQGNSSDNPVSLISDDEEDGGEYDYRTPSQMSNVKQGSSGKTTSRQPNNLRHVSTSDSSSQKEFISKRSLEYHNDASTSSEVP